MYVKASNNCDLICDDASLHTSKIVSSNNSHEEKQEKKRRRKNMYDDDNGGDCDDECALPTESSLLSKIFAAERFR